TSATVVLTARVFLGIKVSKKETPDESIIGGDSVNGERPEVKTLAATSIADVSATLNGDIISVGKGTYVDRSTGEIKPVTCIKRGFKYGLTMTDTWDTNTEATYVKGKYGISATSLSGETDYYFRAYADNQIGRSYGEYVKLTTLQELVFVSYWTRDPWANEVGAIKSYTGEGVAVTPWVADDFHLLYNGICVDSSRNIYYVAYTTPHTIIKYGPTGTELVSLAVSSQVQAIAIASDGYIYTLENTQTDSDVMTKRNPTTLEIISTFLLDPKRYYGL
ncbi:unnamed protein product, partial [marine sediment metagenome]